MQEIIRFCLDKGLLLDKEVLENLKKISDEEVRKKILNNLDFGEKIITKSVFNRHNNKVRAIFHSVGENKKQIVERFFISLGVKLSVKREVEIVKKENKTGNKLKIISTYVDDKKEINIEDFTRYFRTRYSLLKGLIQSRTELTGLTAINKIGNQRSNFSIIGCVLDKRITKNKNLLLEVEDLTGKMNVLINQNKADVYEKSKDILLDDVIGFRGSGTNEILFANDLIYPDAMIPEKKYLDLDESVAFISDLHIGSVTFFEKSLLKFIDWLNGNTGNEKQREEARKVKYLFIIGDSVDGVGVFPGQEGLLNIKSLKGQYEKLAEYLGKIRKEVKIIICPGQHDGVRVAEPQPPLTKKYAEKLYELDNVFLLSNPATVAISDGKKEIKILMYHGASMNSTSSEIESLRSSDIHDYPVKVVKTLLRRRHLSGMHSGIGVVYIPTKDDYLMIKEVPDIMATGDWHKSEIDIYNNILIVANSCWQGITPFEEKVGNKPDYCKVPIFNLKTREIKIMDFEETKKDAD